MKNQPVVVIKSCFLRLCLAMALWAGSGSALVWSNTLNTPAIVSQALASHQLAGQGQMRFLGWRIYEARLWVGAGFKANDFGRYPMVLALTYQRAFSGQDIAERSVQEIERQRALSPALAQRWTQQLASWLPDVQDGDTLVGQHLPEQGMRLWLGDKALGEINDPELARLFFGIWLSPQTSEPDLRQALLSDLPSNAP